MEILIRLASKLDQKGLHHISDEIDRVITSAPLMTLYHGTRDENLDSKDHEPRFPPYEGGIGEGVYFGKNRETAEFYGPHVLQRDIDIQNPLIIDSYNGINYRSPIEFTEDWEAENAIVDEDDLDEYGEPTITYPERPSPDSILIGENVPPFDVLIGGEWVEIRNGRDLENIGQRAMEAGHDAIIMDGIRGGGQGHEILVLPNHPEFKRSNT